MPLLFVSVGWVANSILSHDERIRTLELQAFTKDDAANMEKEFPPPWFRERFDNLSKLLERQQEDISTMKTKITIIETKVK